LVTPFPGFPAVTLGYQQGAPNGVRGNCFFILVFFILWFILFFPGFPAVTLGYRQGAPNGVRGNFFFFIFILVLY
jgi:hypothetical protein